jgi:hypothetical protein
MTGFAECLKVVPVESKIRPILDRLDMVNLFGGREFIAIATVLTQRMRA